MNEVQAARWAKTRSKGRNRFIVNYGLISCGIAFTVVLSALEFMSNNEITPMYVFLRFFVFSVIGIIGSNKIWEQKDRKFQMLTKSNSAGIKSVK